MLSRKQLWRKTPTPVHRADSKDMDSDEEESKARDSTSSSSLAPGKAMATAPKKLRSALNLYAMMSEAEKASNPRPKDTRTMRFSSTVHICLIPSRDELKMQVNELFWKPEDYVTFKHDAVHELRVHLTANGITAKEAIFQLYQPHDNERNQWMKEYENSIEKEGETDRESSSTTNAEDDTDRYNTEEDDEPYYRQAGTSEELNKIFGGVKTDIELNAEKDAKGSSDHKGHKMPSKTPNAGGNQGQVWAVQWKPKTQPTAEHK